MKVFDLELFDNYYYIKRDVITNKIKFGNRTFYAKFERIDEPLTPLLLQQHLSKQYTVAAPLLNNDRTNYLLIEYKGEQSKAFTHLAKHLFHVIDIIDYHIYQGRSKDKIQIFIPVENITVDDAMERLRMISDALELRLEKQWKCLPSNELPKEYNIATIPYTALP